MEETFAHILLDYRKGRDIDRQNFDRCPDREAVIDMTKKLLEVIFPCRCKKAPEDIIRDGFRSLRLQVGEETAAAFFRTVPALRAAVQTDVEAAFAGDPAATGCEEIIFCYPGLYATAVYRLAHELHLLGVPMIPRIMAEHAHSLTGIDIHPGAAIGKYFFIDHGTGIVIGETTCIGDNVKIYQGVTLGGLSTRGGQDLRGIKRHPTIEDNVTIYANASILGGSTVIGHDAVIGASAFVTSSVPPHTTVTSKCQKLQLRSITASQEPEGEPS